ncbi:hypothetical protein ACWCQM_27270 [Streptomyces sp. NPDC002125]
MMNRADLLPVRIAGYDGGPLTYQAGLLDEPLFWLGHLSSCVQSEEAEELLLRNPANLFALSAGRLAQVAAALGP